MLRRLHSLLISLLALNADAWSQTPTGFHWVNFKQERDAVARVNQALQAEDYSAIREIGIAADFALVFTTVRDAEWTTPEGDIWTVYSISLRALKFRKLLSGYDLHMAAWLKFAPSHEGDLGITYLDCKECEPATLFTAFHYDPKGGWRVRWPGTRSADSLPGIVLMYSDAGVPYTDHVVDQVWAVMAPSSGLASIGTWYHSRDLKTGRVISIATKFLVDSAADEEKSLTLDGSAAAFWERKLCKATDGITGLVGGQDSTSCKQLLQPKGVSKRR